MISKYLECLGGTRSDFGDYSTRDIRALGYLLEPWEWLTKPCRFIQALEMVKKVSKDVFL